MLSCQCLSRFHVHSTHYLISRVKDPIYVHLFMMKRRPNCRQHREHPDTAQYGRRLRTAAVITPGENQTKSREFVSFPYQLCNSNRHKGFVMPERLHFTEQNKNILWSGTCMFFTPSAAELLLSKGGHGRIGRLTEGHGGGLPSGGDAHSVWLSNLANTVVTWGHSSCVLHNVESEQTLVNATEINWQQSSVSFRR